jgi:hypothetical protein
MARAIGSALLWFMAVGLVAAPARETNDEGTFRILVGGREIGSEKYALTVSGDTARSTSTLDFQNPSGMPRKLHFESELEMDATFHPTHYKLKTDVDGRTNFLVGTFSPNEAMFEFGVAGAPRKAGLLVSKDYTMLDTNIFHHFIFLVRLFNFEASEKVQKFEVVIPQETDSGVLRIQQAGHESLAVGGRKHDLRKLAVDSGEKKIELWADPKDRRLYKIAVPAQRIDVLLSR